MAAAIGVMAAVALGVGVVFRDRLEWYDAYVEVLVTGLHTRFGVHDARVLSDLGPYLGAAVVLIGVLVSRRRGARPGELVRPLAALAVALLCVEFLKLAVYRERPFSLGPLQHDSFPSGDTAQVAICVATALHLVGLRRIPRDWLGPGMALVGTITAVAIGLSRIYLERHWVTDVGASLLLGLLFWSAAPRWRPSPRKVGLVIVAILVVVAAGPRVVLPSPMALEEASGFDLPIAAAASADPGGRGRGLAWWQLRTATVGYSVLHLEIVPADVDAFDRNWLDLEIDRYRVSAVPLDANRRIYALPLPRLAAGLHEFRLSTRRGSHRPPLSVARAAIAGAAPESFDGPAYSLVSAHDPAHTMLP